MIRRSIFVALVALMCLAAIRASAQTVCSGNRLLTAGGPVRLDLPGFLATLSNPTGFLTVIDVSRPSMALFAYPSVTFEYVFPDQRPVQIQFAAVRAEGQTYRLADQGPTYLIAASNGVAPGRVEVRQIVFDHPLVFDRGQMLSMVVRPASGTRPGLVFYNSASPQGVLVGNVDIGPPGSLPLSQFVPVRGVAAAVAVQGTIECGAIPAPELFIPVVADIQGLAHYSTDVSLYAGPSFAAPVTVDWVIRDRKQNPNAATAITGSATTVATSGVGDSIGQITGLPGSYVGSMTIAFRGYNGQYLVNDTSRLSDDANATGRITARIALGETGSSLNAVSCERIGHTIAVPFHVPAGHRLNVGIASAQLNSCGIYAPARTVVAQVNNGATVIIPMPAETIQLDNITVATNSPLPEAIGLTDGVIYFTVTDEASRIVAYSSLLDNTSQSATLNYGTVVR